MKCVAVMKTIDLDTLSLVTGAWNAGQSYDACTALIKPGSEAGGAIGGAIGTGLGLAVSLPTLGLTSVPSSMVGGGAGSLAGAAIGSGIGCATGFVNDVVQQNQAKKAAAAK